MRAPTRGGLRAGGRAWWSRSGPWALIILGVCLVALVLRVWAPGPVTQTTDEVVWLRRSDRFRTALQTGDLAQASASNGEVATMPGVTTMWAGTLGRGLVRAASEVGLADRPTRPSDSSPPVLRAGRALVALGCVVALGIVMAMVARLFGRSAGLVTGVLLAVEPFLVGHSGVLHTDALLTMFGAAAVLALLAGRVPDRSPRPASARDPDAGPTRWSLPLVALSGGCAAMTLLTKANGAVVAVGGVGLVVLAATVSEWRAGGLGWRRWSRQLLVAGGVWVASVVGPVVALWPALWVAPGTQLDLLRRSLTQLDQPGVQFLDGEITSHPGWTFYPLNIAFRFSPWLLAGSAVALVVVVVTLVRRRPLIPAWITTVLVGVPAAYLLVILRAAKKFDRYALPVIPFLAVLSAVVAVAGWERLRARGGWTASALRPVAAVAGGALVAHTLLMAPYAISYASPLLGGQRGAEDAILLGWGEGTERLAQTIYSREGADCASTRIGVAQRLTVAVPCGRLGGLVTDVRRYDYVITYITLEQRDGLLAIDPELARHGHVVDTFELDGVVYGTLWQIDDPYPPA